MTHIEYCGADWRGVIDVASAERIFFALLTISVWVIPTILITVFSVRSLIDQIRRTQNLRSHSKSMTEVYQSKCIRSVSTPCVNIEHSSFIAINGPEVLPNPNELMVPRKVSCTTELGIEMQSDEIGMSSCQLEEEKQQPKRQDIVRHAKEKRQARIQQVTRFILCLYLFYFVCNTPFWLLKLSQLLAISLVEAHTVQEFLLMSLGIILTYVNCLFNSFLFITFLKMGKKKMREKYSN